jgi:hypothetical protein
MINPVVKFGAIAMSTALVAIAATAPAAAHKRGYAHTHKNGVVVRAPHTKVDVNRRHKRTRVRAPYTSVDVDRRNRVIRIRVPYYNADIRY